jgi:demethylmenaquinone methyltransferase/2-methoxy-6-polyprenyl-1,4-benzoquinol methylase
MLATDRQLPFSGAAEKRRYVRGMFAAIAPRYDLLNHLLSFNIDRLWRHHAVEALQWPRAPDGRYLDSCAGTLDLAATLIQQPGFRGRVLAVDFVREMLALGRHKSPGIIPLNADALELPFAPAVFDGLTIGFGVRNLSDLNAGLAEAARVLKPGARLVILEFTIPSRKPFRTLYQFYFRRVLPLVGRIVSKHTNAYTYLPDSVLAFPEPAELADRIRSAGFRDVGYRLLFGGVCALHAGTRA